MKVLSTIIFLAVSVCSCKAEWDDSRLTQALELYVVQNYQPAFERLLPLAIEGNVAARTRVGVMYAEGQGVSADIWLARYWLTLAAEAHSVDAIVELVALLRNNSKAADARRDLVYWLERAADFGHTEAYGMLGEFYLHHNGEKPDLRRAMIWLHRGAEHYDPLSFYLLGICHLHGVGVEQNLVQAYRWFDFAQRSARYELYQSSIQAFLNVRERLTPHQVTEAVQGANAWTAARGTPRLRKIFFD